VEQVRQEQIRLERKQAKKLRKKQRNERRKNRAAKKELNDQMNQLSFVGKENSDIENNVNGDPSDVSGLTDNNSQVPINSLNDSVTSQPQVQSDDENIGELDKSIITFSDQNEVNDNNSPKISSDEKNNNMFSKLFSTSDRKQSIKEESDSVSVNLNRRSRNISVTNIDDNTPLFVIPKAPKGRTIAANRRKKSSIIIEEKKAEVVKPEQYKSVGRRQSLLVKSPILPPVKQDTDVYSQNLSTNRRMSVKFLELPPELSMGNRQSNGNNEISSDEEENISYDEPPTDSDDEPPPDSDDELPPIDDEDGSEPPPSDEDNSTPVNDESNFKSENSTCQPPSPPVARGNPPPPPRPKINLDVLGAIRQGATLKKAAPVAPKIDLRQNLLSAIKSGSGGLKKKEDQSSMYQKTPSIKVCFFYF
jgi:hypothetical protein